VTALAFRIQSTYNDLLELIQAEEEDQLLGADDDERAKREEERCDKEFVMGEMCILAVRLDYSDEIGRRKMFQLVRECGLCLEPESFDNWSACTGDMISQESLPENLVAKCLDVLRTLSSNERDLIRVVVEVVHDLRDPSDPEDDNSASVPPFVPVRS
jgi:condensin complex subunit 3